MIQIRIDNRVRLDRLANRLFYTVLRKKHSLSEMLQRSALDKIAQELTLLFAALAPSAISANRPQVATAIQKPPAAPNSPIAGIEVFLCHLSGDKAVVRSYWNRLKEDGASSWLDEKELLPGQNWDSRFGRRSIVQPLLSFSSLVVR